MTETKTPPTTASVTPTTPAQTNIKPNTATTNGAALAPTLLQHRIRLARGQVWHDMVYSNAPGKMLTSIPHTDAIPCERCVLIGHVVMALRFVREIINTKKSFDEARTLAKGVFAETVPGIEQLVEKIEYGDDEVRYTV